MSSEKTFLPLFILGSFLFAFILIFSIVSLVTGEINDYKKVHELGCCCACYGERPKGIFITYCECECHNTCCCSPN